jgi:uncharacterized membrane protein YqjE
MRAAGRACRSRLWAGAAVAVAGVFLVETACLGLIAAAWDTPGRLWAIGALAAFFLTALIAGAIAWLRLAATPVQFFPNTQFEWAKDRDLIEEFAAANSGPVNR